MNLIRKDVFNAIENAKDSGEVLGWINKALIEGTEPEFNHDVLSRVRSFGLGRLADLTEDDPCGARELILGPALDLCIAEEGDEEGRHYYSEYRSILLKWLEQYPSHDMISLRNELLGEIARRLKVKPSVDLVWVVSVLGFREDRLCALLKDLALSNVAGNHPVRDAALSTICFLGGLSEDEKESFRVLAEIRLSEELSISLFNTLLWIRSTKSVDFLLERLTAPSIELNSFFPDHILFILSKIAETCSLEISEKIWKGIIAAVNGNIHRENSLKIGGLVFNSGLLKRIDLKEVPIELIGRLYIDGENHPNNHFRYIIYTRLLEFTGINQLNAFTGQYDDEVLQTIKADCIFNTGNTSRQTSHEDGLKQSAWEAALRLGVSDTLDWFEGVLGEDSPYMRGRILNYLACFRLDKLPDKIGEWICKRDNWDGGDTPEIFYIQPAIQLVGNSSDPRALEWLLDLGMTYRGQVPTIGAEALSGYCVNKIRDAEDNGAEVSSIVSALLLAFDPDWGNRTDRARQRRMLAASALEAVSEEHPLSSDEIQGVVRLFHELDVSDDLFALCPLARIVANAEPDEHSLNRIKTLANHDNTWVAAYGVYALESVRAYGDDLELLQKNGLSRNREVVNSVKITELGAFLLGNSYIEDKPRVSNSVIAVIESGDWRVVSRLLQVISSIEKSEKSPDDTVFNALRSRIFDRMCESYSETNLFKFLAKLDPEKFLETEWCKHWPGWSPESRVALIGATFQAVEGSSFEQISLAIKIFGGLERDPVREVRQNARHAWSLVHSESFSALIEGRSTSTKSTENDFRLAAEALWAINDEGIFNKIFMNLSDAPERRVREACSESIKIRQERTVAQHHLNAVLTCEADTSSMLGAWKHGSALIEIGHADHLLALQQHLTISDLSRNQFHWVRMIAEKLEKNIKEKKRKESPDWSPPGAQTIRQSGKIIIDNVESNALFVIRFWESAEPGDIVNWDGDGWFTGDRNSISLSGNAKIELDDGSGGTAMIQSISNFVSFSFSGMKWTSSQG